jgi:hypothetical protein
MENIEMTSKEAFAKWYGVGWDSVAAYDAHDAWQAALEWAAKGQEPVAWLGVDVTYNNKPFVTMGAWASYMPDAKPLYLHPAPIREGWKWVPIEPTEEMIDCAYWAVRNNGGEESNELVVRDAITTYKAMLDAAPEDKE